MNARTGTVSNTASRQPLEQPRPSVLTTFKQPRPSPRLMRALDPINRLLCLHGTPVLRDLPGLRHVPGLRGLADVRQIDLPSPDLARLREAAGPGRIAFITPNHPEFFTDWMIDKEILSRVAPMAACWATHTVVNGLGPAAQWFWLRNNLIAQIPGTGGRAGREHSVTWALAGHGVLLHPEGEVGWHNDLVAPIFPGAIEMAMEAARLAAERGEGKPAHVAPVVWKLRFVRDCGRDLHRELDYVDARLGLPRASVGASPADRVRDIYGALLAHDELALGLARREGSYADRQRRALERMADMLSGRLGLAPPPLDAGTDPKSATLAFLRECDRTLRGDAGDAPNAAELRDMLHRCRRLLRFQPSIYGGPELTQEHVAECVKRIRADYCAGTLRDTINRFVPRPVGPRVAHVRVPEPIAVSPEASPEDVAALVATLRTRMQAALDAINAQHASAVRYPNPFRD